MAMKEKLTKSDEEEELTKSVDGEELTEALVLFRTRASDLESVKKLNCWACNIGDIRVVRRMPNLEVCSLTINKLKSLRDFAHCQNLQELYVRTNNVQQLSDIHYLKNLRKLRSLWLSENPCATGKNYRMTVLKTLPTLQKLDNIAVTADEVSRAQDEGDDLPLPEDFLFFSVFKDGSSLEDFRDERTEEVMSVSSDKAARARQKRQQKKRENYMKEISGADEESVGADSGGDGGGVCEKSGDGRGNKSMSSSDDNEDLCRPDTEESKTSFSSNVTKAEHKGQWLDDQDKAPDVTTDEEEAKTEKDESNTKTKWAFTKEIQGGGSGGDRNSQNIWEIKLEKVLNLVGSDDKEGTNKSNIDAKLMDLKIEELNNNEQVVDNEYISSLSSELSSFFHDRKVEENGNPLITDGSLSVYTESVILTPTVSNIMTDEPGSSTSDFNNSATSTVSFLTEISSIGNNNINTSIHHETPATPANARITEQTVTPLLDRALLEDSLFIVDETLPNTPQGCNNREETCSKVEEYEVASSAEGLSEQVQDGENENIKTTIHSAGENREPVNWEEYNLMREQLGVGQVERIPITARSLNTELVRIRNSNILQAVLSLVKELDKDSLDIVASAVKGRLSSM